MMKIDPYNREEKYKIWKEKSRYRIQGINKENSEIILRYVEDMEHGKINFSLNISYAFRNFIDYKF